jgi:glycosyltransferase involved in cell wall biosynthesis
MAQVAIILPVFNGANYLREAILSIYSQTFIDWRLYVVDDSSSDESWGLIASLPHAQRVVAQNDRNIGLYATLAQTMRSIQEEWVGIVMQDDRAKPNWLETAMELAYRHPAIDALWANEDIIDAQGNRTRSGLDTARIEVIQPGCPSWYSVLQRGCIWQISGSLTKTRVFKAIPFDSSLPHCGDYDWLLRAIRKIRFLYYERPLIDLRSHSGQASAGNLARGQDVAESYFVLRKNVERYGDDLGLRARLALSFDRTWLVAIRMGGALLHGRFRLAARLSTFIPRFLMLWRL